MSKNNDYTTGNLLAYDYFSNHYNLIAINLWEQTELENPDLKQQINFIGKLDGRYINNVLYYRKIRRDNF